MRFLSQAFAISMMACGPAAAIGMGETAPEQAYVDLANNSGAYQVGDAAPDFRSMAAIGLIEEGGFELFGTGTLVAPAWLLTAAHVVVDS